MLSSAQFVRAPHLVQALNKISVGWLATNNKTPREQLLSALGVHSFLGQGLQYVNSSLGWLESAVGAVRREGGFSGWWHLSRPALALTLKPQQKQQRPSLAMFNHREESAGIITQRLGKGLKGYLDPSHCSSAPKGHRHHILFSAHYCQRT